MGEKMATEKTVVKKQKNNKINKNKKPKVSEAKTSNEEDKKELTKDIFNLKDVLSVGGLQEDFEMLKEINEEAEIETQKSNQDEESNIQSELQSFIKELGLDKFDDAFHNNVIKHEDAEIKIDKNTSKEIEDKEIKHIDNMKEEKVKTSKFEKIQKFAYKEKKSMLLRNCVPWYEKIMTIPRVLPELKAQEVDQFHEVANQYWQDEIKFYQQEKDNDRSSDAQWLRTVLTSGTMSDKLAALTMITQESPLHCIRSLESLMNLAKKKSRREALTAVDSLRHIWIGDLLPEVKLRNFNEYQLEDLRNLSQNGSNDDQIKLLMMFAYEHRLKSIYSEFVDVLQNLSKDPLVNIRSKILGIIYELLSMKPEQEQKLLTMLVNKLGDPERKISSKTSFLLTQLVSKHPNMQEIVVSEVERMMYRPNVSEKAQYYGIIFLNQIVLSHQKKNIASKLISVYFTFFKVLANKKVSKKAKKLKSGDSSQETKLISGLLTGVNRAFPYAQGEDADYEDHINTLFKLTHTKHLSTSLQALMLIYQVMETRESISDRYYQALYEKLLDPEIKTTSKHAMLLNLLFKSLKNDSSIKRIKSFIKRLLQVCIKEQPSLLCGVLFLISEVVKAKPGVRSILDQPEDDDDEEHFVDAPDDDGVKSEEEFSDETSPPSDDKKSDNESNKNKTEETDNVESSDIKTSEKSDTNVQSSWTFISKDNKTSSYNINHRNPLYAGGELTCAWDIIPLISYFHPSLQHFVQDLLKGEEIKYKGDPLQDFTLIRFLDRFMYRNPKKNEIEHGSSIMQPKETSSRLKEEPVNSKNFIKKSEENVRQDELFFYQYFKQKDEKQKKKHNMKDDEESDLDEGDEYMKDLDFAGEMRKNKEVIKKKMNAKKIGKEDVEKDGNESDDSAISAGGSDEDEFDYDDLDNESDEEEDFVKEKQNFTDKDYENALFENMNSDGESVDGDNDKETNASDAAGMDMFAAADEFAHMLEDDGNDVTNKRSYKKQKQWEERTTDNWKNKKQGGYRNNQQQQNRKRKSNDGKFNTNKNKKRK